MPPMSSTVVLPVVVRAGYRVYLYWTGAGWIRPQCSQCYCTVVVYQNYIISTRMQLYCRLWMRCTDVVHCDVSKSPHSVGKGSLVSVITTPCHPLLRRPPFAPLLLSLSLWCPSCVYSCVSYVICHLFPTPHTSSTYTGLWAMPEGQDSCGSYIWCHITHSKQGDASLPNSKKHTIRIKGTVIHLQSKRTPHRLTSFQITLKCKGQGDPDPLPNHLTYPKPLTNLLKKCTAILTRGIF